MGVRRGGRHENKQRRVGMAIVRWTPGIESVSGKLSGVKKGDQHSCDAFMLATHRVAATTNPNCNRLYMRTPVQRSTPLTQREIAQRERFSAVATMVNERKMDLSKVTADQEAFLAQKDQPGGKKTMKSWYWDVCGKEYDEAQA